jgi:hypothetical protein
MNIFDLGLELATK